MARGRVDAVWSPLRAVFEDGTVAGLPDGEHTITVEATDERVPTVDGFVSLASS